MVCSIFFDTGKQGQQENVILNMPRGITFQLVNPSVDSNQFLLEYCHHAVCSCTRVRPAP